MEDVVMNTSNITNYKPQEFAEMIGVSVKTLQRWDNRGKLKAYRTPTDRRYYTRELPRTVKVCGYTENIL